MRPYHPFRATFGRVVPLDARHSSQVQQAKRLMERSDA